MTLNLDPAQIIGLVIGAGGLPVLIRSAVKGWREHRNGQHAVEKARNLSAMGQRDDAVAAKVRAERERDAADRRRRQVAEYASELRRLLIEGGVEPPPFPPHPDAGADDTPGH